MSIDSLRGEAAAAGAAVRVEFTGRAGVGRSALVDALGPIPGAEIVETAARDRPGASDPVLTGEIVVLVLLDPPRDTDRAAAVEAADRLLPVLTKTDTLTDLDGALARASAAVHAPCLPVTTVGPDAGLPGLREAIEERVRTVRAARAAELLSRLRTSPDTALALGVVDDFLVGDDGVRLLAQSLAAAEPAGDAYARARYWRARMNTGTPNEMRVALVMHRAAVREWAHRG